MEKQPKLGAETCLITFKEEGSDRHIDLKVTLTTYDKSTLPDDAPKGSVQSVQVHWLPCEASKEELKKSCSCGNCGNDPELEPLYINLAKATYHQINDKAHRLARPDGGSPLDGLREFLEGLQVGRPESEEDGSELTSKPSERGDL